MNNKAILLRSVSTLATAAASTALGVHGAQAQVVPAGTNGYYYSAQGGFALSKSEQFLTGLTDKVGNSSYSTSGSSYSSYTSGLASGFSGTGYSAYASSYSSGLDDYKGLFASVSFGKQVTDNIDVRGTLSITGTHTSGFSYASGRNSSYSYYSGVTGSGSSFSGSSFQYAGSSFGFGGKFTSSILAADFEVGYTPTLSDNFNVRLFAGVRALQFTQKFEGGFGGSSFEASHSSSTSGSSFNSSFSSSYNGFGFNGVMESTFTGVGPRIGVQGSTRFEGSNFGLSGSLASSVLFGKQTTTWKGSSYSYSSYVSGSSSGFNGTLSGSSFSSSNSGGTSGSSVNESSSANKTVLDLQASASVDYYLKDNTVLSVGYQGEKLMEVNGDDESSLNKIDSMTHGAFVKLSGTF